MVEDKSLPFPESVAASEIPRRASAGRRRRRSFKAMGWSAPAARRGPRSLREVERLRDGVGKVKESFRPARLDASSNKVAAGGITTLHAPARARVYRVGYIIGPELAALNFSAVCSRGALRALLVYFLGPHMIGSYTSPRAPRTGPG